MASSSDHTAKIIDGKAIAHTIRSEIAEEVRGLSEKHGKVPGLAVVIVGSRKDSQTYVNTKRKACAEVGIKSFDVGLPEEVSEADLIIKVHELNSNPDVHGILVQLPLPKHINEETVLGAISIDKDVDGFHPLNIGKLAMKGREPLFLPCTPKGCLELLARSGVKIKGQRAVVVGRSNIVGLPVSLLLLKADATVTTVHSHTKDPEAIIREADIVIAACGQAHMIKGNWIKPGAAVIDVGTNAVSDPSKKSGYRLVGDVDFAEASKVAGFITPVPGGVGPMTVAMLLRNTVDGAKRVFGESSILEDVPEDDGDVHRASSSNNSVGSSSMYGGGREVPMFHCHDMSFKEEAPFTISDLSEENMLDSNYGDELSSEELVLQDLQRASQKLTDETRKCFRDTFYRLARSSQDNSDSVSPNSEELLVQTSRYDYGDGNRLSREEEIESETNSIDRAVANLTFNKMESNISNFPLSERVQ